MAAAKKKTKKDLEDKIAELEAKLTKLSTQLASKPAEVKESPKPAEAPKPAEKPAATTKPKGTLPKGFDKPAEAPKPAETKPAETKPAETKPAETKPAEVKPAEKPAATTKPKGTLPKGFDKPADAPKPQDAPKPAETTTEPPATVQAALENAYYDAPMTDFHQYRAKVTGYTPAPNRYFVRLTAPVGTVPTTNWNDQKASVTGYTQPSNQYFATRPRLAYHPADKKFGSFSGVNMTVEGVTAKAQTQQAPPPKPKRGTLPKGF